MGGGGGGSRGCCWIYLLLCLFDIFGKVLFVCISFAAERALHRRKTSNILVGFHVVVFLSLTIFLQQVQLGKCFEFMILRSQCCKARLVQ